jgi:F-type H+-transporting ATPase subunit a
MASGHDDVFHHIRDFPYVELPLSEPLYLPEVGGLQLTKFMLLQVVAGLLTLLIFRGLARRIRSGEPAKGRWWNFWESIAVYLRDEVVRPTIGDGHEHDHHGDDHHGHAGDTAGGAVATGGHPADRFLPFIWSCFFYILFCNLLGAVPLLGSPTGHIAVTGMLALTAFAVTVISGSVAQGPREFWLNLVPKMDVPAAIGIFLIPGIWLIEVLGLLIKHGVLAMRLFANIMAGHTVVAVILGFIAQAWMLPPETGLGWVFYVVTPASILGQVAIGLLELFVAFLQAYIFAFLATLFIGMSLHAH